MVEDTISLASVMPTLLILGMAVTAVSVTITRASIFGALRGYLAAKSTFFGDLFSCTYCMSHWVSFLAITSIYGGSVTVIIILTFTMVFIVKVYTIIIDLAAAFTERISNGPTRRKN